jgi:molybdopterin converting factor small subunit
MVKIRIHSVLRDLTGLPGVDLDGGTTTSVGTALTRGLSGRQLLRIIDETGRLRPHINVFVDGISVRKTGGLETPLPENAVVDVFPSVSGG